MVIWKGQWDVDSRGRMIIYRIHHTDGEFVVEMQSSGMWQFMKDAPNAKELNMCDWHGFIRNVSNLELIV